MLSYNCLLALSVLFIFNTNSMAMVTFDVVKLGAKPDGETDSTMPFQRAWKGACGSHEQARIYVPEGTYLLHESNFEGPCKNDALIFEIIGTLVAPSDYKEMANVLRWIKIDNVNGLSIQGGVLDGKGKSLWDCKKSKNDCPQGATTLTIHHSSNINVTGLTSRDSEIFHICILRSQNVRLENVKVFAAAKSPNTDGIHVQHSTNVKILHSNISTGDDCVSVGQGTSNLWIENVGCGPGHGISIGSLGKDFNEEGVHHITVKSVSFRDTQNGVRIKTWGRPCNAFVREVVFQHATMDEVENPIIIDQNYCLRQPGCSGQGSGVKITNITYSDIHGTSATEVAMNFYCSETNPCTMLSLEDINLTHKNKPAKAFCHYANGKSSGKVNPKSCFK